MPALEGDWTEMEGRSILGDSKELEPAAGATVRRTGGRKEFDSKPRPGQGHTACRGSRGALVQDLFCRNCPILLLDCLIAAGGGVAKQARHALSICLWISQTSA